MVESFANGKFAPIKMDAAQARVVTQPNMVLPGLTCPVQASVDEMADTTIKSLWRTVPAPFREWHFCPAANPPNWLRPV
jgi:hypothetical protein